MITRKEYREENGIIYFDLTSDGTTGREWGKRLNQKHYHVSNWAWGILESPDFKPTSGETTTIAIVKGILFKDKERTLEEARAFANEHKFIPPNPEIGCLMRETFYDWELGQMGLDYVLIMHEPIHLFNNPKGRLYPGEDRLLDVSVYGGEQWAHGEYMGYYPCLRTHLIKPGDKFFPKLGFAFVQINNASSLEGVSGKAS